MTRFTATRPSPGPLELVYRNPPFNLLDDDTFGGLDEVVGILEEDADVRVAVFRSGRTPTSPAGTRRCRSRSPSLGCSEGPRP